MKSLASIVGSRNKALEPQEAKVYPFGEFSRKKKVVSGHNIQDRDN